LLVFCQLYFFFSKGKVFGVWNFLIYRILEKGSFVVKESMTAPGIYYVLILGYAVKISGYDKVKLINKNECGEENLKGRVWVACGELGRSVPLPKIGGKGTSYENHEQKVHNVAWWGFSPSLLPRHN
jgi:hypothetical protein